MQRAAEKIPIHDAFTVRDYNVPQRPPAVLGSTRNGQDAFATARWDAGRVEHVHAVFSGDAVGWVFVRVGYNFADRGSQTSSSTQRAIASFMRFLAS